MYKIPKDLYQKHEKEFQIYLELLLKWNSKINLTAITDPREIIELHFLDSLAFCYFFESEEIVSRETILDIGSGNGLPGLALKIIYPGIKVTLAESIQKKCSFIKTVARNLNLDDVTVLNETIFTKSIGSFDMVISRATCSLKDFIAIGTPQLKQGGLLATLKGARCDDEIKEAGNEIHHHKLSSFKTEPYELSLKESRHIVWTSR